MKVGVLGASGFIGRRFVELYKNQFDIISLSSKEAPLRDYQKLKEHTRDCDVLVHAAFDHNYKDNIIGIKNVLRVCKDNNIKKLIYLSTISVYDPDIIGVLNESSPYSKLNDPYSKEKRKVEKIIDNFEKNFDVIVLQPSIVYGLGGNWTKYALHVCKAKKVLLPNNGQQNANIIYVDDVAQAIKKSIENNIKYEKILISNETVTWKEFYCKQCDTLKELNLPSNCNIVSDNSKNEFHSNKLIDLIFIIWFKTFIGNILTPITGFLKNIRARNYKDLSSQNTFKNFILSNITEHTLQPSGITKKVHNTNFRIDTTKAKSFLNLTPQYSFHKALSEVQKQIKEMIK